MLLTVHGWLYVVYLACDFVLWRVAYQGARSNAFLRFLWIAMGGIVPFLSFYFERQVPREVEATAALLAGSEHERFDGAGHSLLLESVAAFDRVIAFARA